MKVRFFRYQGSKNDYVDLVNSYIDSSESSSYCEPFVGSGAIIFNLKKTFEHYTINDKDRNIIRMYRTFRDIEYIDYINSLEFIEEKFGDIKESKISYYNFRNWFNETHWDNDTIEEGLYLHSLANSCINSMLRFGPNGMNQSFGHRFYTLSKSDFEHIKEILLKCEITNVDYLECVKNNKNSVFFLDPPYFSQKGSYESFSETDLRNLISIAEETEYVYTDILNEINNSLNGEMIRDMRNTAPNSDKSTRGNLEYIFSSLEKKGQLDEWM